MALLAEHDLQYSKMQVSGEYWLRDTAWGRCLAKCADNLENLSIFWCESDGEDAFR